MAIIINPKYSFAFFNRGLLKIRMNQIDEGCEDMKKSESLGNKAATNVIKEVCNN